LRDSFKINREDALLYHLVLNTERIPIDTCVKTVCQLAREPQFQDKAAIRSALGDRLLEHKVYAALTEHFGVDMDTITVSAARGRIILDGKTSKGSLRAKAEELAHKIEGVKDIHNRIARVASHGRF
jgi:osmotically-inducible protein OsmY